MRSARVRVAVCVTRTAPCGTELLVFEHRDHADAGVQVPAGGVEAGELLGRAALREVEEETGAVDVRVGAALAGAAASASAHRPSEGHRVLPRADHRAA
ncbi:NUDIX domain-containing protein [Streptomyces actuosus]|uniref:NUDIX domain-containing protein n=1 Tax=Streptomyces actuosus TaxID=1885 RepID=UPI001F06F8F3|nr:NUDIX domain-containing protein [Streptomyces actuosus]